MAKYFVGILFFGLFFGGGLFSGYLVVTQLPLAIDAKDWPVAEGMVDESKLRRRQSKPTRHTFQYSYQIDSGWYFGQRITFMDSAFYGSPEGNATKYPQGTPVMVFYNPADPSVSVLDPNVWWVGFATAFVVAIVFVAIGFFGLRATFR